MSTPYSAIEYAKKLTKNMPMDRISLDIQNEVLYRMWMAAPFRWTVESLPSFDLVANTSEYNIDFPDDFLYAIQSVITNGEGHEEKLDIVSSISQDVGYVGRPSKIAFLGSAGESGVVRISPLPAQVEGTEKVIGLYKKTCPSITTSSQFLESSLPFSREWFRVYKCGVLYLAYHYSDDRRAGETNFNGERVVFTGARADFELGLEEMRKREPLTNLLPEAEVKNGNL